MNDKYETAPIRVTTATDERYLPYLACNLISVVEHGATDKSVEITIIQRGLSLRDKRVLESLIPQSHKLRWVEPTPQLLWKAWAPVEFELLPPHYFRLLASFLHEDATRTIYLDADTLVLGELAPLWTMDLQGYAVAAARDSLPCMRNAVDNWEELYLDPDAPYFNSGVLVIDLVKWREERISQRAFNICWKHQKHLLAQGKWPQYDQYGLNVVLNGKWKMLASDWNYGADLRPSQAKIVHYFGNGKPSLPTCQPYYQDLFFNVLKRTPFEQSHLPENRIVQ